jgi:hypothetical protein
MAGRAGLKRTGALVASIIEKRGVLSNLPFFSALSALAIPQIPQIMQIGSYSRRKISKWF